MVLKILEGKPSRTFNILLNENKVNPRLRLGFHLDDKLKLIPTGRCEVGKAPKLKLNVKFSESTFESEC
jgi:hypothetical protein